MSKTFLARLPDRAVIRVGGPDAAKFLQDLVTNDMDAVHGDSAGYGALLTPQGKILFDFFVFADGGAYLFDVAAASAADFAKRLGFYRLRAKVDIEDVSGAHEVAAAWGGPRPAVDGHVAKDPRLAAMGWRIVAPKDFVDDGFDRVGVEAYLGHRIAQGVPESGADFALGDAFPHDADLDQLNGVSFKKGCYVGQEVVSRMEHRGTARRRVVVVRGASPLPPPGTPVTVEGRPIGTVGSNAGSEGLAMLRLDRVADARANGKPVMAGELAVDVSLQSWVRFGWPAAADEA
jgi:folate-binding protein YgfZ